MKKNVFTDYLGTQFMVCETAREAMCSFKEKVTEELYYKMFNTLVGFEKELQVTMASNMHDAVCFGWERYTYIDHVDNLLKGFYLEIDKEFDRF